MLSLNTLKTAAIACGVVVIIASPGRNEAWDECEYEREIDSVLTGSDLRRIEIDVAAGDLVIEGSDNQDEIRLTGKACASRQKLLDDISLIATDSGRNALVKVKMPDSSGWSWGKNQYAYVDLKVVVPNRAALEVDDSSGDMRISDVGAVRVDDSSGDIRITNAGGDVWIDDSSGSIEVTGVTGEVEVDDSSGDIDISVVSQRVLIDDDSSGDIRITDVEGDAIVESDSSGSIHVRDIAGNFRVGDDGSGSIRYSNVAGNVDIPKDKRRD